MLKVEVKGMAKGQILQIQIDVIPENTKKATKYGLHVFQRNLGEFTFSMRCEWFVCFFIMLTVKY